MDDYVSVDEDVYDVRHDEEAVESPAIIHDRVAHELLDPSSGTSASAEEPAFAESPPMMNADGNPATDQNEELASEPAARFLLSSKHLTLASPYFKTTLGGVWRETRNKSSSELLTTLKGFDVDATLILMQVIHGQLHETPTAVTLELLAKISVLVDYLGCHQAFRFVSRIWFAEMTVSPPNHYGRELVLWILISKVFSEPKIFETTTKTAIISSYGRLQTMELPLPNALIGRLVVYIILRYN
ncbi:hypothetical protein CABS01_16892 [Colletotrichum abscissum]|uniref:uncharacterized protein n=1 Tax=Colletotrichum abscissum TaxID=1671311 RepID=UPI0027D584CC|nr:uncharacterized protein CABS01_16892 [Colletotrichum abscissum]KAK1506599.1 hypothetical protein CABS01_16892 [Colletotrichum abscissum]